MSVIVEKVELFKDFNLSQSWCKDTPFDKEGFKIEFKDGKARVYGNEPFSKNEKSKFSKLTSFGQWTDKDKDLRGYALTVNGNRVYFRVDILKHKIN